MTNKLMIFHEIFPHFQIDNSNKLLRQSESSPDDNQAELLFYRSASSAQNRCHWWSRSFSVILCCICLQIQFRVVFVGTGKGKGKRQRTKYKVKISEINLLFVKAVPKVSVQTWKYLLARSQEDSQFEVENRVAKKG